MVEFYSRKEEVLGSFVEIFLPKTKTSNSILNECFIELKRIQDKYSRFNVNSPLNKLNHNLNQWQKVDFETLFLIKTSLELSKMTKGYFDVTLNETLEDLGYDINYTFTKKKIPLLKKIFDLKFIVFSKIIINEKKSSIYLRKKLDFGGIGKGYALDRIYEILESYDIQDFLINAGGDIRSKSTIKEWIVHLAHPEDKTKVIGEMKLNNFALAGSAPTHRIWGKKRELHHLINPKTNKPQTEVKAIFILTKNGLYSDSLATALFVSGYKNAIKFSKKLNIEILIISSNNEIYKSKNFNVTLY